MKKYKVKLIETYAFDFEVEANNRVEKVIKNEIKSLWMGRRRL